MFCFQCQETAKGTGCVLKGVCGKSAFTARNMDLLLFVVRGIAVAADSLRQHNVDPGKETDTFVTDALFSTITNANFDDESIMRRIDRGLEMRDALKARAEAEGIALPGADELEWTGTRADYDAKAATVGVLREENEDLRSLKELVMYGLKGLALTTVGNLTADELTALVMKTGEVGVRTMALLDKANTATYGNPEATNVNIGVRNRPGILISGHDLHDLGLLLEATKDKGINVYTHGEMLPCHAYPGLRKYPHLKGHFGTAWQNQQKELKNLPAPILFTTNCIMPPKDSYADRVFTTSVVEYPGMTHIGTDAHGKKDFTPLIEKALELGGFKESQHFKGANGGDKMLTGFGHKTVLSVADKVVDAVKTGALRHIFLVGGCDGAKSGRSYYADFVKATPKNTLVLTLACGKFRFNDLDIGDIGGIPRLLDMGQCNDAYSAIKVASALAEVFKCSVNDLPLSLILSWYEQKAVAILLTLLYLGIKDIRIGPSLPAFVSPAVLNVLVEKFGVKPITTPEEDLKAILG